MLRRPSLPWTVCALLSAAAAVVLLAPLLLAQDNAVAKVIAMSGRVSVLRDSTEWALNLGSPIQPKQIVITGADGYARFQIADGSTFEVFQNSRMVFRANPLSWTDLLDVLIGRVKVSIQHRNGPNPNRVTTETAVISVRGTVFDVVVDEDDTTTVSVDDGVVGVRHRIFPSETELHAGESIQVFKNQPLARRVDKGSILHAALRAAAQAVYDVVYRRPGGVAGPSGGTVPAGGGTAQGDKGKGTGGSGGGAPPAPPAAPSAPPPPPPAN